MAGIDEKIKSAINDTADTSSEYAQEDKDKNKNMAILSYILPFIPYFTEVSKESKWVKYHATQGMNLLVIAVAYGIINAILTSAIKVKQYYGIWGYGAYIKVTPWWVTVPLALIGLCIAVLAVMGILNAVNGKAKELPLVNKLKLFK